MIKVYDEFGRHISSGSGFSIDENGIIVTNFHVISGAASIKCTFDGDKTYDVDYICNFNITKDIAILQLKTTEKLPFVTLGDSDKAELAEDVVAIGNPLEFHNTVSTGIVSGLRKILSINLIQTTASISAGSSGGPLFNLYGEVIGMTSSTLSETQNMNFAVPSNSIKSLLPKASIIPLEYVFYFDQYISESEPNNAIDSADEFLPMQYISGEFSSNTDIDYYKVTFSEAANLNIYGIYSISLDISESDTSKFSIQLLKPDGTLVAESKESVEVYVTELKTQKISAAVEKGDYYLRIQGTGNEDTKNEDYPTYSVVTFVE